MRPIQSMYALQEEWQEALVKWMDESPTRVNNKQFMIFEGKELSYDNFLFEGDLLDFSENFFPVTEWPEVLSFAKENEYTVIIVDTELYDDLCIMLDDAAQAEEEAAWHMSSTDITERKESGPSAESISEWTDDYRGHKHTKYTV